MTVENTLRIQKKSFLDKKPFIWIQNLPRDLVSFSWFLYFLTAFAKMISFAALMVNLYYALSVETF